MQEYQSLYDISELPIITRPLKKLLTSVDRFLDRVYTSRYNPLYRSGTLAVFCLFAAMGTGLYLIFFYRIGTPYESIVDIQAQTWGAKWMRAMHRWVSDAAVVALVFHILRLLIQGKTWGQRTLAWLTGVFLTILMFISAWTGYVMVWDEHGLAVAKMGAKILDLMMIFPESFERSFTGLKPVPPSFFFMNLFAHVAVPLGMIMVLWLHTFKLARAKWLPEKHLTYWLTATFVLFSIFVPAPLMDGADTLAIPGGYPTDFFYNAWMPFLEWYSPQMVLGLSALITIFLSSFPWWWRPKGHRQRLAVAAGVDVKRCEGCSQCYSDCPFDAITMEARNVPGEPALYSSVNPELCVSCGICIASCSSLAIGPSENTARDMIRKFKAFSDSQDRSAFKGVLFVCKHGDLSSVAARQAHARKWLHYDVDCTGSLHSALLTYGAKTYGRVGIAGCPENNCVFREGPDWLKERWQRKRGPPLPLNIPQDDVFLFNGSQPETKPLWDWMDGKPLSPLSRFQQATQWASGIVATVALLSFVAWGSQIRWNEDPSHGALRLGWRLPGQKIEECRDLTQEELNQQLAHMRRPRECKVTYINYRLRLQIGDDVVVDQLVLPPGLKHDRPLDVSFDRELTPGEYQIKVAFIPEDNDNAPRFEFEGPIQVIEGRVVLIALSEAERRLKVVTSTLK